MAGSTESSANGAGGEEVLVLRLRVRGRVQGVGYRAAMAQQARRLGISGWVRNRTDGSVEAVICGSREPIETLLAWARRGPPAAQVGGMDLEPAAGAFERFEQRPSF